MNIGCVQEVLSQTSSVEFHKSVFMSCSSLSVPIPVCLSVGFLFMQNILRKLQRFTFVQTLLLGDRLLPMKLLLTRHSLDSTTEMKLLVKTTAQGFSCWLKQNKQLTSMKLYCSIYSCDKIFQINGVATYKSVHVKD